MKEDSENVGLQLNIQNLRSWHPVPSLFGKQMGKQWKQWQTLFSWAPKSLQMVTATMKLKDTYSLKEKSMTNLDSILKSRDITLPTNVHLVRHVFLQRSCLDVRVRLSRILSATEFELWCWRRLLRVLWTADKISQS